MRARTPAARNDRLYRVLRSEGKRKTVTRQPCNARETISRHVPGTRPIVSPRMRDFMAIFSLMPSWKDATKISLVH